MTYDFGMELDRVVTIETSIRFVSHSHPVLVLSIIRKHPLYYHNN